jgi:hypothetical protein
LIFIAMFPQKFSILDGSKLLFADFRVLYYFFLSLFHELDLFHVGVAQNIVDPPGFADGLLGYEADGTLGTGFHAFRGAAAEVALDGIFHVRMGIDGPEGAGLDALEAGYADFLVQLDNAVDTFQGVHGAGVGANRDLALTAYDRHAHHGVGIGHENTDCAFFRVVDLEMLDGTGELANPATGAQLRYYR